MIRRIIIILVLLLTVVVAYGQQGNNEERKRIEEKMLKGIMEGHGPVDFIGKILDQNGDAVSGATVKYSYSYFCYGEEWFQCTKGGSAQTDENGFFEVKEKKAESFRIEKIKADGYDTGMADNSFKGEWMFFKSSPFFNCQGKRDNPAIFVLRKKGEPTMLFTSGEEQHFAFNQQENQSYAVCLAGYVGRYPNMPLEKALSEKRRIDLTATAKFENGICKLTLEAVGAKNAGLLVNEEQLYEAPTNGYESKAVVEVEDKEGNRKKIFLYVKSGDPLIYSRIDVETVRTNEGLYVKYYSWTNPYGERGLEQGCYMSRMEETYKKLKHEAADSLTKGKYPPKPDFKALEEEGKKEYLKTHKDMQ